jgi:uncharacterized protein
VTIQIGFPFGFDTRGRTAGDDDDEHVRDLIEQILFTTPGERVNRPTFGSGLLQAIFAPNSVELVATTQFLVQGALQQWVGDLIELEGVDVQAADSTLTVGVQYVVRRTGERKTAQFTRKV